MNTSHVKKTDIIQNKHDPYNSPISTITYSYWFLSQISKYPYTNTLIWIFDIEVLPSPCDSIKNLTPEPISHASETLNPSVP
jgi:hypothetical protein